MKAAVKPAERASKSLLAGVLAVSLCPLVPSGQSWAEESGGGSE